MGGVEVEGALEGKARGEQQGALVGSIGKGKGWEVKEKLECVYRHKGKPGERSGLETGKGVEEVKKGLR